MEFDNIKNMVNTEGKKGSNRIVITYPQKSITRKTELTETKQRELIVNVVKSILGVDNPTPHQIGIVVFGILQQVRKHQLQSSKGYKESKSANKK